jgi:hypothetical protein
MTKLYLKNSDEKIYKKNKYDLDGIKRSKKLMKKLKKKKLIKKLV